MKHMNHGARLSFLFLSVFTLLAVFAPWIAPYLPEEVFTDQTKLPPFWMDGGSTRFLLGTDDLGRDLLSRLIYGARVSMGFGLLAVLVSTSIGGTLGVLAGFYGGWLDRSVMRVVDVLMSIPSLLVAIVVVAILGPSLINALWAVSIVALPGYIRVARAAVLAEKEKEYVQAARAFGASSWRQILTTILPNCTAPLIVQASLGFSDGILNMAALGFLGLGAQPPTPEWGAMLSDAKAYLESAWWLVTWPGLCILAVVLTFNLLGDGLRDALDPKL